MYVKLNPKSSIFFQNWWKQQSIEWMEFVRICIWRLAEYRSEFDSKRKARRLRSNFKINTIFPGTGIPIVDMRQLYLYNGNSYTTGKAASYWYAMDTLHLNSFLLETWVFFLIISCWIMPLWQCSYILNDWENHFDCLIAFLDIKYLSWNFIYSLLTSKTCFSWSWFLYMCDCLCIIKFWYDKCVM